MANDTEATEADLCQCKHPRANHRLGVPPDGGNHDACTNCPCGGFEPHVHSNRCYDLFAKPEYRTPDCWFAKAKEAAMGAAVEGNPNDTEDTEGRV